MLVSPKQPWSIPFPASGPSNHPVISPSLSWEVLWIYFLLTHLPGCWPRASCALMIAPQKTWVKGSLSLIKSLNKPEAEFHGKGNILEIKYRKNSRKMWRSIWMKNLEKKPKSSLIDWSDWSDWSDQYRRVVYWALPKSLMSASHVDRIVWDVEVSSVVFSQRQQLPGCFWLKLEGPV